MPTSDTPARSCPTTACGSSSSAPPRWETSPPSTGIWSSSPRSPTSFRLRITCQVTDAATGEDHAEHASGKLIVPDRVLMEQFADAGLDLVNVGRVVDLSRYHHDRVRDVADLGMQGTPKCYYRATRL
jgi:hypothetical protein